MNDDGLKWEEVRTEHVVKDEWIDFRRVAYRLPDGVISEPFYNYSRRSYVVIAAKDADGRYLVVRQFRHGIGKVTTEFPAGGIETKGETEYGEPAEEPLEAAKRELLEETGCVSDKWRHLVTVPADATMADNYAYVFMAEDCRRVSGQSLDSTEFLDVGHLSGGDIRELVDSGRFEQAIHIMAWLMAERIKEG